MHRRRRGAAAWGLAALLALGMANIEPARADAVEARAAPHDGYGRIVFEWPERADVSSALDGDRLTLRFTRPITVHLASLQAALGARYVAAAAQGSDPDSIVLTLKRPVTVKTWHEGRNLVVDLVDRPEPQRPSPSTPAAPASPASPPPPQAATSPAAPHEVAGTGPLVPVHANVTDGRDRLTFDWPAPTGVTWHRSGDVVTLRFDRPGRADFADVDRTGPCIIEKLDQQADPGAMLVNVTIPRAARIRTFRVGPRTVVDVLGPKTCRAWVPATPAPAAAAPAVPAPAANQGPPQTPATPPAPAVAAPAQPPAPPPIPTLVFDPGEPAGVAVYARAGYLYVVFDRTLAHAAQAVQNPVPPNVRVTPVAGAPVTAFQIVPPPLLRPVLSQQGTGWRIRFVEAPPADSAGIAVEAQPDYALGGRLFAPASDARQVVPFTDPTVGDRIEVVPLAGPGEHIDPGRRFAPLDLLATLQGIVVVRHADSVTVRVVHDGLEMTMPGGVPLSPAGDTAIARPPAVAAGPRLLDIPAWIRPGRTFIDVRQDLERRAAMTPLPMRQNARFELARFFLARGDGQEALGLLDLIGGDDPDLVDRPEFRALRGAARVLADRPQEGLGDLAASGNASDPTISLWRGWAEAEQRDWPAAARDFAAAATIIDSYPDPLFSRVAPLAAEAALRAGQPLMVTDLIGRMRQHAGKNAAVPAADYLEAVLDQATGHPDAALPLYRKVADSLDQYWSTRAELAFVDLALERNLLTPAQATRTLDRLSYAWRGDWLETAILRKLGETDMLAGRYADAIEALRHAEARDPSGPEDKAIHAELVDDFARLFDPSMNGKVTPVDAVTIFQQNRDLLPAGPAGDKIIANLAERLVGLDLLGQAADLLNADMTQRLHGTDKATVGARLAAIRLLDQKPQAALDALGASDQPGLPADLTERRTLLKARALADLNKGDAALALLGQDQSHPADQLRADIAWRAKNWLLAAAALDRLIGPPPAAGAALPPETEKLVLNRAVALSLAGDVTSIATLRDQFGTVMAKTPDANAFKVLTDPTTAAGGLNLASVPGLVAGVDLFKSFLDSYRAGNGGAPATQ